MLRSLNPSPSNWSSCTRDLRAAAGLVAGCRLPLTNGDNLPTALPTPSLSYRSTMRRYQHVATDPPGRQVPEPDRSVMKWLLDSDPSIRWQAMRDLIGAPAEEVA